MAELVRIVVRAALGTRSEIDSVEALSESAGVTRRVLQNRCQAAGVTARDCVHFVQCLKAIIHSDGKWELAALLPINDPRTLRKMLAQAGLATAQRPDLLAFVRNQQFCTSEAFKDAVIAALHASLR